MSQGQASRPPAQASPVVPGEGSVSPQTERPFINYALIGLCALVYLLQAGISYFLKLDISTLLVKDNSLILQGQVWRLITPIFLHSLILHIAFNMYALFFIGSMLERYYGHFPYLGLFLLSSFGGTVISFMFSNAHAFGSSPAVFGLLGAIGVLIYQNREIFSSNRRLVVLSQVVIIAVINVIIGLNQNSGVDFMGCLGGLIGGTLFAWFGGPVLRKVGLALADPVVNMRNKRETLRAGIGVAALFLFLTVSVMVMRRG